MWFKGNHIRKTTASWLGHVQTQILSISKCKNALQLFQNKNEQIGFDPIQFLEFLFAITFQWGICL